jgi:dipeptidyl aminopeptidase/acylaminoacyl peptidase
MKLTKHLNLLFLIYLISLATVSAKDLVPAEAFSNLPLVEKMSISPDGKNLAFFLNKGGKSYFITKPINGNQTKAIYAIDNKGIKFSRFWWANNERLLLSFRYPSKGYKKSGGYTEITRTKLIALNLDGSNIKQDLISDDDLLQYQDKVINLLPDDVNNILISLLPDAYKRFPHVYKLNIYTGYKTIVQRHRHRSWISDNKGEIRLGIQNSFNGVSIIIKDPKSNDWHKIDDVHQVFPIGFGNSPEELYTVEQHEGKKAIFKRNITQWDTSKQLIISNPDYDVQGRLLHSSDGKKTVGLRYVDNQPHTIYWDQNYIDIQTQINKTLPSSYNLIESNHKDAGIYIISSSDSNQPVQLYLLNTNTNPNTLSLLANTYPGLDSKTLSKPETIIINTRDNTSIESLFTQPKNTSPGAKQSLIVFPHRGPQGRDYERFDYWTQFFISRGWSVLQPNFRGSSGYGKNFVELGFQQWGLKMQDDITDATQWVINHKNIDPDRVCIVGASYGGYAALMSTIKTPKLIKCAVSFAGVSNLQKLISHLKKFEGGWKFTSEKIGNQTWDWSRLNETSPSEQADKIKTPLLILHGESDRVVPIEQSKILIEELENAGNDNFQFIELPDGTHFLDKQENRTTLFKAMDRFLTKHLE